MDTHAWLFWKWSVLRDWWKVNSLLALVNQKKISFEGLQNMIIPVWLKSIWFWRRFWSKLSLSETFHPFCPIHTLCSLLPGTSIQKGASTKVCQDDFRLVWTSSALEADYIEVVTVYTRLQVAKFVVNINTDCNLRPVSNVCMDTH